MKQPYKKFTVDVSEVVTETYYETIEVNARTHKEAKAKAEAKFGRMREMGDMDCNFGGGDVESEVKAVEDIV